MPTTTSNSQSTPDSSPESRLAHIRIVLVAPAGPLNIGSIARVMKNFGLSQLVLVSPQCDPLGEEAMQMAVHAKDLLERAQRVDSIPEALVGCRQAIATTARSRSADIPLLPPQQLLPPLVAEPNNRSASIQSALIFGPEDRGLSNSELSYAQQFLKISSSDAYSALNLAQAVAVCCYELFQATLPASLAPAEPSPLRNVPLSAKQSESAEVNQAQLQELEGYYQHLESLLLEVGYLYPHTAESRMRKVRQLMHRAAPTSEEVSMMRGMLRQMQWALSNRNQG